MVEETGGYWEVGGAGILGWFVDGLERREERGVKEMKRGWGRWSRDGWAGVGGRMRSGSNHMSSSSNGLAVLTALDTARTQWYHITTIVIAGMGFFTDAYDLFCISTISKLLGRLYFYEGSSKQPGKLSPDVNNIVTRVALIGTLTSLAASVSTA
ncbi:uncharacterized protein A4U43_C05F27250 [Asparagus officinalis]|uniref:Major facilitator superfamily (MFS) profile domain-containing protein n=1 Tax=Asparagus officinalis TaxID=4686 RepID=A0A5P1EXC8_ASPOF|nr:uncharacterized protein A4U43_C05F27250 [Asparagus officinalis]